MPTSGNAAASTALPQPPNTSQNVPSNSANTRLVMSRFISLQLQVGCNHPLIVADSHHTIMLPRWRPPAGSRRHHPSCFSAKPAFQIFVM